MKVIASILSWAIAGVAIGWLFLLGYSLLIPIADDSLIELLGQVRPFAFSFVAIFLGTLIHNFLLDRFNPNFFGALFLVALMVSLAWGTVQRDDYYAWLAERPATTSEVMKSPLAWWANTSDEEVAVTTGSRRRGRRDSSFPRWAVALMTWGIPVGYLSWDTWKLYAGGEDYYEEDDY